LFALAAGIQLLGRSLGWLHCSVWYCGADGGGHGDLSERSSRTETRRVGPFGSPFINGGSHRRCTAALTAQTDDGLDRCSFSSPDYVEYECRFGSNEASGNTCSGRHGIQPAACVDSDAGDLLLASRTKIEKARRNFRRE